MKIGVVGSIVQYFKKAYTTYYIHLWYLNKNIIFFLFAGKILRTKKLQRSVVGTLYALIHCLLNFLKPFIHIICRQ